MRAWFVGVALLIGWILLTRSRVGVRIGSEARSVSDRLMLAFLRVSSEFEREL